MARSQAPLIARSACLKGLLYFICIIFDLWFDFGEDFNWPYPPPGRVIVCSSPSYGQNSISVLPILANGAKMTQPSASPHPLHAFQKDNHLGCLGCTHQRTHCPPEELSVPQSSVQQPFFIWDLGETSLIPKRSVHSAYQLNLKSQVIGTRCYQHQRCSP